MADDLSELEHEHENYGTGTSLGDELSSLHSETLGNTLDDELNFHAHPHTHSSPPFGHAGGASAAVAGSGNGGGGAGASLGEELSEGVYDGGDTLRLELELDGAGVGESLGDELHGNAESETAAAREREASFAPHPNVALSQRSTQLPSSSAANPSEELVQFDEEALERTCRTLQECIAFNDHFLHSLSSISLAGSSRTLPRSASAASSSSSSAIISNSAATSSGSTNNEDTSIVESSAEALVRQLRQSALEREGQARELRELARDLNRGDFVLTASAASELDWESIEGLSKLKDPLGFVGSGSSSTAGSASKVSSSSATAEASLSRRQQRLKGISEDEDEEEDEGDEGASSLSDSSTVHRTLPHQATLLSSTAAATSSSSSPSISEQMQNLRSVTSTLIHSLSSMHEHTQVSRAASTEASRRIRALKSVLNSWKVELEELQLSHDWLSSLYATNPASGSKATDSAKGIPVSTLLATFSGTHNAVAGTTSAGAGAGASASSTNAEQDVKSWSKAQLERAERILSEAEQKAHQLLRPVPCEALDRLVAGLPPGALDEEELRRRTKSALAAGA